MEGRAMQEISHRKQILIVEDEEVLAQDIQRRLEAAGFDAHA